MKKLLVVICFILMFYSCTNPTAPTLTGNIKIDSPKAMSIIGGSEFVGDAYNVLDGSIKSCPFANVVARRTVGEASSTSTYSEVTSHYELESIVKSGVGVDAGSSELFDLLSGDIGFAKNISDQINITSDSVVIVGVCNYIDSTVFLDSAQISQEASNMYFTNPQAFQLKYGNGYVDQVQLGERLVFVLKLQANHNKTISHNDLKITATAMYLSIVAGGVLSGDTTITNTLRDSQIITQTFATSNYIPASVNTRDGYVEMYNGWREHINTQLASGKTLSVLSKKMAPHDRLMNSSLIGDVEGYYHKYNAWAELGAKIQKMQCDTNDSALISSCSSALSSIRSEEAKCLARDASSRYPNSNEFIGIERQWIIATSCPVAIFRGNAVIASSLSSWTPTITTSVPATISSFLRIDNQDINGTEAIDELNRLKSMEQQYKNSIQGKKGFAYYEWQYSGQPIKVLRTQILDSIPLYCLEKRDIWGKPFHVLTTDISVKNDLQLNWGYGASPKGYILGFIFPNSYSNTQGLLLKAIMKATSNYSKPKLSIIPNFSNLEFYDADSVVWNFWTNGGSHIPITSPIFGQAGTDQVIPGGYQQMALAISN